MTVTHFMNALPHHRRADPADAQPRHSAVAVVPLDFFEQHPEADKGQKGDRVS